MYHLVVIIRQNTSRTILSENLETQCGCLDRMARVLQTLAFSSGRMSFAMINLWVGQCMNLTCTITDLSVFIRFSIYVLRKSTIMYLFFSLIVIKEKVVEVCINLSNVTNICCNRNVSEVVSCSRTLHTHCTSPNFLQP